MLDGHEIKTKPTTHGIASLRMIGLNADIIVGRCELEVPREIREKIGHFTNVKPEYVISAHNVKNVFEVPLVFAKQAFHDVLAERLGLGKVELKLDHWVALNERIANLEE